MNEIRIEHITKKFKKNVALDDISLNFEYGKIYGFLGRNGAGKSTLINIISNRIFPDKGCVTIDGETATENASAQNKIFCMSEKDMYPKSLKIENIFKLTNEFYDCFDTEKALRYAKEFGLDINKKVSALSTGYGSIFKLIITLSLNLPYIFLDEPVLGLDANHRELFYKLLLKDYEDNQRTIIIATHLIEEVANLIEDVVIIDKGKLIMQTSVEELYKKGYSISGLADEVDKYCNGKNVIGFDTLGALKVAYIIGTADKAQINDRLSVSTVNLQKLFIKLTEGEE
jgi:ABC-2 type transport system ATP-binding protein